MSGSGAGRGKGLECPGLCYAFIWFLLILLFWWVAFFIAWIYILLLPFSACCSVLEPACDALLKIVQLPFTCAKKMLKMAPLCGASETVNPA